MHIQYTPVDIKYTRISILLEILCIEPSFLYETRFTLVYTMKDVWRIFYFPFIKTKKEVAAQNIAFANTGD